MATFADYYQRIQTEVTPEADGFMASIFRVKIEDGRATSREFWRRIDLPRPTESLARQDAQELAITELHKEDATAEAAASGQASQPGPPKVTAEQIMERMHARGLNHIGDSLRRYLSDVPRPYALGFERAIYSGLLPPKEITLPLYLAGFDDGKHAYSDLLAAGAITEAFHDLHRWRDPTRPRNEGIVLSGSDQFADYAIELMALDVQPIFEPGYPPAEDEIRELRVKHYLQGTASLHERPLPEHWHHRIAPDDRGFTRLLNLPSLAGGSRERRRRVEHGMGGTTIEEGILKITASFGRTGDDEPDEPTEPAEALAEMKRMVGSVIAMLEERRQQDPDSFLQDPVTTELQQQAAELRRRREQGPTQIPEISDEREAELQAQGQSAQASVRGWNEDSRRNFEKAMARLAELEQRLRERGVDLYGSGGWKPRHERGDRHWPHDGQPSFGWEPYSAPGITEEQLLYEIATIVEQTRPGEFDTRLSAPGLIEIRPREPEVVVVEYRQSGTYERIPQRYQELQRALGMASGRWRVDLWGIRNTDDASASDRWIGQSSVRWHTSLQRTRISAGETQTNPNTREEYVHLEVQLAPPGSRAPAEWEC